MKYLCLAYEEESMLNAVSKSEWDALRDETLTYVAELRSSGRLISTEPLQSVSSTATVRVRDGKLSITDGPFAETKETLGEFFLINRLCENFLGALRRCSGRTDKYSIFNETTAFVVRLSRTMNAVFTQSVNASDLNEAIQMASRWPSARLGSIEVRPIEAGLPTDHRYV